MAREPTTWIKLDRNITDWRWYGDGNTFRVFIHLLLTANIKDREVGKRVVKRGTVLTNYSLLADRLDLSYKQVRRSIENLIETQEVAILRHGKYVEISILRYDAYQDKGQLKGNQRAILKQGKHLRISRFAPIFGDKEEKEKRSKREKEEKEFKNTLSLSFSPSQKPSHKPYQIPTLDDVREYERASGNGKDPELFYKHYSAEGWKANGKKVYNWKRLYDEWQMPEIRLVQNRPKRFTDADGVTYEWVNGNYEKVRE